MAIYRVDLLASASLTVEVEADSPDEAVDAAFWLAPSDVCARCSGWGQEWSLDLGEWEAMPGDPEMVEG